MKDLLQISGMARSAFYYYLSHPIKDKYECEKQEITAIFNANKGRYGYRRVLMIMRKKGYVINHKTVFKLMKLLGLKGKQRKSGKYNSYKGEVGKIAENLLKRDFKAEKPFEKLTTDVTQFKVCDTKVYLSPVMDLFNREVISYSISLSPNLEQVREMLDGLFGKLPDGATPLFHSDQGWQYQHTEYQRLLAEHNIKQSMSRKGNCTDTAHSLPSRRNRRIRVCRSCCPPSLRPSGYLSSSCAVTFPLCRPSSDTRPQSIRPASAEQAS